MQYSPFCNAPTISSTASVAVSERTVKAGKVPSGAVTRNVSPAVSSAVPVTVSVLATQSHVIELRAGSTTGGGSGGGVTPLSPHTVDATIGEAAHAGQSTTA